MPRKRRVFSMVFVALNEVSRDTYELADEWIEQGHPVEGNGDGDIHLCFDKEGDAHKFGLWALQSYPGIIEEVEILRWYCLDSDNQDTFELRKVLVPVQVPIESSCGASLAQLQQQAKLLEDRVRLMETIKDLQARLQGLESEG